MILSDLVPNGKGRQLVELLDFLSARCFNHLPPQYQPLASKIEVRPCGFRNWHPNIWLAGHTRFVVFLTINLVIVGPVSNRKTPFNSRTYSGSLKTFICCNTDGGAAAVPGNGDESGRL